MALHRSAPLYQQVYELLRRKILAGEYAPGESLHESRTAQMLQVSRTPVREALRQLEQDGLLVAQGPERAVRNLTREEFIELYTCRMALERLVADRAASLATEAEIEDMAAAIKQARSAVAAGDHGEVLSANTRFHDRMVESARMKQLRQLMGTIRGPILVARRRLLTDPGIEAAICGEHEKILDAIRRKDIRAAQEHMEWHMKNDIERGIVSFDR